MSLYKCKLCQLDPGSFKAYVRHLREHHPEIKKQPACDVCKLTFADEEGLKTHNNSTHVVALNKEIINDEEERNFDDDFADEEAIDCESFVAEDYINEGEQEVKDEVKDDEDDDGLCSYQKAEDKKLHQRVMCIHKSKIERLGFSEAEWRPLEDDLWRTGINSALNGSAHPAEFLCYDGNSSHGHLKVGSDLGLIWWKERVKEAEGDFRAWSLWEEEPGRNMKVALTAQAVNFEAETIIDVLFGLNACISSGKCQSKGIERKTETEATLRVVIDKKFRNALKENDNRLKFVFGSLEFVDEDTMKYT